MLLCKGKFHVYEDSGMNDRSDLPPVARLLTEAPDQIRDVVVMDYDARLMRRKRLRTVQGHGFMVDLPSVTNLDDYWGFQLEDGSAIQILPAEEEVLLITGDLPRLAWHIGNRHTPCEVHADHLLIREDHVLERMLRGLGARITRAVRPFAPESGAYGTGRTMGHDHGPAHSPDHVHGHHPGDGDDNHGHHHSHSHDHDHDRGHDHHHGAAGDHNHGHHHRHDDDKHGHDHAHHTHDHDGHGVHHHGAHFHGGDDKA